MPINQDLLEILACPKSKQPVHVADEATLARLNERIRAGTATNVGGATVTEPITEALVTEDGATLYPIRNDIPVMLIDEGISLA